MYCVYFTIDMQKWWQKQIETPFLHTNVEIIIIGIKFTRALAHVGYENVSRNLCFLNK